MDAGKHEHIRSLEELEEGLESQNKVLNALKNQC